MPWQRIVVSTQQPVGPAGDLPSFLVGLNASTLANLPAALSPATIAQLGLADAGYVEVAQPSNPRWITVYQFYQRFTQAERVAIYASTDTTVQDFLRLIATIPTSGPNLNLDDPQTEAGVNYLEQTAKLIATGRAAQILA